MLCVCVCLVNRRFSQNYYHFLIESLPRLMLLRDTLAADPAIQIISHSTPFSREILNLLGYGDRIVETGAVSYEDVLVVRIGATSNTYTLQ
jgi:capsular polysaccharide biosynthesis protein